MSFVYAEKSAIKIGDEFHSVLNIYGDTKVTTDVNSPNKSNWGTDTYELVKRYGVLKTMIIEPRCCIAFAGNDIKYAHELLEFIHNKNRFTDEELWEKAFEIHRSAPKDAVEFILCTIDDQEESHIVSVKNGTITYDCQRAWIGSPFVYQELTKLLDPVLPLYEQNALFEKVEKAIMNSGDNSVGGFISHVRYDKYQGSFVYAYRLSMHEERMQPVAAGDAIIYHHSSEHGGFAYEIPENNQKFRLDFFQSDLSLVYTNKYRLIDSIYSEHIKHFMLPILCKTSTGTMLPVLIRDK